MHHRQALQVLFTQFNMSNVTLRYNYDNIAKSNISNLGHQIVCELKPRDNPEGYTTVVNIGPYLSLEDVEEDLEFFKRLKSFKQQID